METLIQRCSKYGRKVMIFVTGHTDGIGEALHKKFGVDINSRGVSVYVGDKKS